MIGKVLAGLFSGPWGAVGAGLVAVVIVGAVAGGVAWLRADAAADATLICEARWTGAVTEAVFDETRRRAERAEANLRAQAILSERDAAEIGELEKKVDDYARERAAAPDAAYCELTDADIDRLLDLRR